MIDSTPVVNKILNFVELSRTNYLIILTGTKKSDFYKTKLQPKQASQSIKSHRFQSDKDLVCYIYLVFNCPHIDAYCHLISSVHVTGLQQQLTVKNIRTFFPHHDINRSQSHQAKKPVINEQINELYIN